MSSEAREEEEFVHEHLIDRIMAARFESGPCVSTGERIVRAANRNRVVWELGSTIQHKRGVARSTFKRHVVDLLDEGWLIAVRRPENGKKKHARRARRKAKPAKKEPVRYYYIVKDPHQCPLAEVERAFGEHAVIHMELYYTWRRLLAKKRDPNEVMTVAELAELRHARKNWAWVKKKNVGSRPGEGAAERVVSRCQELPEGPLFLCQDDVHPGSKMDPPRVQNGPTQGPKWTRPYVSSYCLNSTSLGGTFAHARAHTREETPPEGVPQGPPPQEDPSSDSSLADTSEGDREAAAEVEDLIGGVLEQIDEKANQTEDVDPTDEDQHVPCDESPEEIRGMLDDALNGNFDAVLSRLKAAGRVAPDEPEVDEVPELEDVAPDVEPEPEAATPEAQNEDVEPQEPEVEVREDEGPPDAYFAMVATLVALACRNTVEIGEEGARELVARLEALPGRKVFVDELIGTKCAEFWANKQRGEGGVPATLGTLVKWLVGDAKDPLKHEPLRVHEAHWLIHTEDMELGDKLARVYEAPRGWRPPQHSAKTPRRPEVKKTPQAPQEAAQAPSAPNVEPTPAPVPPLPQKARRVVTGIEAAHERQLIERQVNDIARAMEGKSRVSLDEVLFFAEIVAADAPEGVDATPLLEAIERARRKE